MLFTSVNIIEDFISAQSSKLNRRVCKDVLFGIFIVHPEKRTKKKKIQNGMQNCQVDFTCDAILELVAVAHSLTEPEKNKLYVIATLVQICIRGVMCDSIARLMKQTIQTENWTFLQSASGANIINDSNLQHFAAAFLPRHLIPFGADVTYLLNDFRILQRTALCLRFYLPLQNLTSNRVDAT